MLTYLQLVRRVLLPRARIFRLLDSPVAGESMIGPMMIGQLASRTGLSVRTLRFYADAGVLPENGRSAGGYRLFGPDAGARARPNRRSPMWPPSMPAP